MLTRLIVPTACALALAACNTNNSARAPAAGEVVLVLDAAPT